MRFDILNIIKELRESETDTKIIARLGKTGSGKTLRQTEENVLPLLIEGQEVYCCYWLNWNKSNYHYFAPRDFDKVKNLRNSTIVFDETRRSFEPRSWESESEDFRGFVELHRHRHNTIILNTQDLSLISKTFAIQAHQWSQLERVEKPFLLRIIDKIFGIDKILLREDYLTFGELKKMANGWELDTGEDEYRSNKVGGNWRTKRYKPEELIHRELNDTKIELYHYYCPKCASRQGQIIPKEMKWEDIPELKCPKHKEEQLLIKESGIYDSDYDIPIKEKEITFQALIDSPKGYRKIPYKGALSANQIARRKQITGYNGQV